MSEETDEHIVRTARTVRRLAPGDRADAELLERVVGALRDARHWRAAEAISAWSGATRPPRSSGNPGPSWRWRCDGRGRGTWEECVAFRDFLDENIALQWEGPHGVGAKYRFLGREHIREKWRVLIPPASATSTRCLPSWAWLVASRS